MTYGGAGLHREYSIIHIYSKYYLFDQVVAH
jgi:hypothetical protein